MSNPILLAAERERLLLEQAESFDYQELPDADPLKLYVYKPDNTKEGEPRPCLIFFYSSVWDRGNITQFAPHALFFAERGAICVLAEYRTKSSHQAQPIDAVADACSAVRWARTYSDNFNIDREKIVTIGARAGAHMAASTAFIEKLPGDETDGADFRRPNAVMMISGIYDLDRKEAFGVSSFDNFNSARALSLSRHISGYKCPVQMIHGTEDSQVDCQEVEKFARKLVKAKFDCEFLPYEGRQSTFYNLNVDPVSYEALITSMDDFMVQIGLLPKNDNEDGARLISWREQDY